MLGEVLRTVCTFSLAASLAACNSKPDVSSQPTPTTLTPETVVDYVSKYYPELKDFGLRASGLLTTKKGVRIHWYNYTDFIFNPKAAATTYSYFEDVMPKEGIGTKLIYQGREITIVTLPREGNQPRALFITPPSAPRPSWWQAGIEIYPSAATFVERHKTLASYVHFLDNPPDAAFFNSPESYANRGFDVEACQAFIIVGAYIPEGSPVLPQKVFIDAQEAACNSLGLAFALRQLSVPFSLYSTVESARTGFGYQLIKLTKTAYDFMPSVGKVLSAPQKSGH